MMLFTDMTHNYDQTKNFKFKLKMWGWRWWQPQGDNMRFSTAKLELRTSVYNTELYCDIIYVRVYMYVLTVIIKMII